MEGHVRGTGGARAPTESLNSLEGETSDGDEGDEGAAAKPKAQLYGFRFLTLPNDGRPLAASARHPDSVLLLFFVVVLIRLFCSSFACTATRCRLLASIYSFCHTSRLLLSVSAASRSLSYESSCCCA